MALLEANEKGKVGGPVVDQLRQIAVQKAAMSEAMRNIPQTIYAGPGVALPVATTCGVGTGAFKADDS